MKRNRRRRDGRLARAALVAVGSAAAAGAAAFAVVRGARWASVHPYFAVRTVSVTGAADASEVVAWSGIRTGMSVWAVDGGAAEVRLVAHPRIRAAAVRRALPDRVEIAVEERSAVAVLLLDHPMFVDGEGVVFPPLPREPVGGLPYVTGFRAEDLVERPNRSRETLRQAARCLALWRSHAEWPAASEVRREENDELVVFPERTPMRIRFGSPVEETQFARLSAVLDRWRGREDRIASVDLSVPDQAVLTLRGGRAPSGRGLRI